MTAETLDRLDHHSFDGSGRWPLGALLRAPGAVFREIYDGQRLERLVVGLAAGAMLLCAAYGAILGLFSPGLQTLYAAIKVPIILLGSAALCTPTFFIFNTILGGTLTFRQSAALLLCLSGSAALILVAFAPIAWFFTFSTHGFVFLTLLHVAVFIGAISFGIRQVQVAREYLAHLDPSRLAVHAGFLRLWFVILLFVGLQMAHVFRPLLAPGPFYIGERGLFLEFLGTLTR